jgi:NAD(P)-dependent dehydrogenase (short-subunit alcohol dehydrogenase family)
MIQDLSDRVFVITGGNSGIGYEAARVLMQKGAHVVLACRDPKKMSAAAALLREAGGASADQRISELVLDLSSLASIEKAAADLAGMHSKVDVLINNAGVMALPERATADGFEMQFGTNHLGHFAFTGRVLPLVLAAPHGRIVTVSSLLHDRGHIEFNDIPKPKVYDPDKQYSMSKLANVLFTNELQRKLKAAKTNAIAVACHPGYSDTNLQHAGPQMTGSTWMALAMRMSNTFFAQPSSMGALGTLYAAAGDVDGGEYIGPVRFFNSRGPPVKTKSCAESYDEKIAARLWDVSSELTHVAYDFM